MAKTVGVARVSTRAPLAADKTVRRSPTPSASHAARCGLVLPHCSSRRAGASKPIYPRDISLRLVRAAPPEPHQHQLSRAPERRRASRAAVGDPSCGGSSEERLDAPLQCLHRGRRSMRPCIAALLAPHKSGCALASRRAPGVPQKAAGTRACLGPRRGTHGAHRWR